MKFVITERQLKLLEMDSTIRRRIHIADDFISNLNPEDVCLNWKSSEVNNYVNTTLSDAVHLVLTDNDLYDEVYDYLSNKYRKHIRDFFFESLCDQ